MGHPDGLPELFIDRSLGRIQVPRLLRAEGLKARTLAEEYGIPADEEVADADWLALAGGNSWPVLMKDERIRYRSAERQALIAFRVQAFCLTNGNLRAAEMAEQFVSVIYGIAERCQFPGPFLFAISSSGFRRVDL